MADVYNLTAVESTTEMGDFLLEMNLLTDKFIFSSVVIAAGLISYIALKSLNFDTETSFMTSSIFMTFLAGLLLFVQGIGWVLFGICLTVMIGSIIAYGLRGQ